MEFHVVNKFYMYFPFYHKCFLSFRLYFFPFLSDFLPYLSTLQDRKDKEGRDREKRKQRRDKERGKGKERHRKDETDSENDRAESYSFEDIKRSGRDKDRKHRKRHHSSFEDLSLVEDEQNRSKNFHRHSIDHKRSKQVSFFYPLLIPDHRGVRNPIQTERSTPVILILWTDWIGPTF